MVQCSDTKPMQPVTTLKSLKDPNFLLDNTSLRSLRWVQGGRHLYYNPSNPSSFPAPITVSINWTLAPRGSMHAPSRHRIKAALWGATVWTFDKHRHECSTVESVSRSRINRKAIRNYSTSIAGGGVKIITTYMCMCVGITIAGHIIIASNYIRISIK